MLCASLPGRADQVSVPHIFVNGQSADANEVNANFSVLADESNDQDQRIDSLESGGVVGPEGPQGPAGPPGATGATGATGVVSSSIVTPRSCTSGTQCACPAGEMLLSGGASCGKNRYLYSSRPLDRQTWEARCEVFADGSDADPQSIDLLCVTDG